VGYVIATAVLWGCQARLIFRPDKTLHASASDFPFSVMDVSVSLGSGGMPMSTLHGLWIDSGKRDGRVVLYLHGNDGNVGTCLRDIVPLRELGYSILLIDYRGYGQSAGAFPSEPSVYEDAEAAWNYLVYERHVDTARLHIYGHSLGGAVAIELALRHPEAAGLIVESSFTSMYDMAALEKKYALLPIRFLLNQRFDSICKVGRLRLPVLFIHGTEDEVVPFSMGMQLYNASGGHKCFVPVDGGEHDNNARVNRRAFQAAISTFVIACSELRQADGNAERRRNISQAKIRNTLGSAIYG
jgi:pimeloyl-ACP methyl ester carboxylesterase